ncbi:NAD(P)/FAD-dependent oxidoreductase [Nocardia takedensis]|uniref:NAD(P)/FAD-dependent oxidoreductase n=1 Tax=Nocardia takedensis TaxID=259390 RepID=UPI0002E24DB1|nr:FAD-dependent oxidoreductase [Nocardia takedensis]
MTGEHRIVVLGAGYAGLAAARTLLRGATKARITVVDARAEFVERVRLHQRAAGQHTETWDLATVLGEKGVAFVHDRAVDLDLPGRRVLFADAPALEYDTLIYALGSAGDRSGVPGAVEYATTVATPTDIAPLTGPVVIVGAGATGIELAAELAETRPDTPVALVSAEEPGGWMSAKAAAHVRRVLDRLGVRMYSGAKVVEVLPNGVRLADGEVIDAATTVWTTGFTVPDLAARSGLAVDATGRVRTDATLRSVSHPEVYAVGDSAVMTGVEGGELRMACATALPAGQYVARAIADRVRGREPKDFRYRYVAQCLSLGRRDGVLQLLRADDSPARTVLTGRLGALVKEGIVRGTAWSTIKL